MKETLTPLHAAVLVKIDLEHEVCYDVRSHDAGIGVN